MDWIYLFTSFNGRISRQPFWIACVILGLADVVLESLAAQLGNDTLSTLLDLALTYPQFAVAVKRSNDRNLPPWLVALLFAINVALDLFILMNGSIDTDSAIFQLIGYPFGFLALVLLVELGFRRGTEGPNRFGEDPLADGGPRLLHQYAAVRRLDGLIRALTPDEPFIFRRQRPSSFQEELPRSVKYWCFTITAVNALICLIAGLMLHSFAPALMFAFFTAVGPVNLMLSWKRTIRHLNNHLQKPRMTPTILNLGFTLSIEWCAIVALVGTSLFLIIFLSLWAPH
ncbi:MAG TPA: DUF805 domain-containing protein [Xanthobacteraceae bacterium]|nr:DUF805 domain-containing protein [Xanthobacteraceae bacterium]